MNKNLIVDIKQYYKDKYDQVINITNINHDNREWYAVKHQQRYYSNGEYLWTDVLTKHLSKKYFRSYFRNHKINKILDRV